MHKEQLPASTWVFVIQSALLWSFTPILYSFLPAYLNNAGFHESRIGILMALGPLMSAILQPFIGMTADRSNFKNTILMLLMGGSALSILLLAFDRTYLYVFIISLVLAAFQSALIPMSETITLEGLDRIKKPYGPVRAGGTIGYSVTSILIGLLIKQDMRNLFYVTAFVGLLGILSSLYLPRIKGHQSESSPVSVTELFKDKLLVIFMLFSMVAQLALGFYQSFFPIYYQSLGGTGSELGVMYFIAAMCELPFLFFSGKIIKKLGIQLALSLSMGVMALRFILLYVAKNSIWLYPVSALHGLTFIVFAFSLAVYINQTVRKELRATGQVINGFISMGIGRILGSVLGGFLIEGFGLKNVMLFAFVFSLASIALFIVFCTLVKRKHGVSQSPAQG